MLGRLLCGGLTVFANALQIAVAETSGEKFSASFTKLVNALGVDAALTNAVLQSGEGEMVDFSEEFFGIVHHQSAWQMFARQIINAAALIYQEGLLVNLNIDGAIVFQPLRCIENHGKEHKAAHMADAIDMAHVRIMLRFTDDIAEDEHSLADIPHFMVPCTHYKGAVGTHEILTTAFLHLVKSVVTLVDEAIRCADLSATAIYQIPSGVVAYPRESIAIWFKLCHDGHSSFNCKSIHSASTHWHLLTLIRGSTSQAKQYS